MATFTVSTKPNKTGAEVKTVLTVDWNGITEEQLKAGYASFMVVKLQGGWRKNGIPSTASVKAADYAPGTRHAGGPIPLEGIKATLPSMTPEQKAALLALLK